VAVVVAVVVKEVVVARLYDDKGRRFLDQRLRQVGHFVSELPDERWW